MRDSRTIDCCKVKSLRRLLRRPRSAAVAPADDSARRRARVGPHLPGARKIDVAFGVSICPLMLTYYLNTCPSGTRDDANPLWLFCYVASALPLLILLRQM